ncbi:MAG: hypothetical protein MJ120_01055 [Clostridia bacterium]|nr:hypothetical protein [Clostridia bacterium]
MAIEKMKLVRIFGKVENLDSFITSCCISGDFHPENAMNYVSAHMGYVPVNDDNPYTATIQKIEELAQISGATLKEEFSEKEIIVDADEVDYIDELVEKLGKVHSRRTQLASTLEECADETEKLGHFTNLETQISDLLSCEFMQLRFGSIPNDCYPKLKAYEDNENILFIPCEQDEKRCWGVYAAPVSKVEEIDRIFATLYFERIDIKGGEGTPAEIIKKHNEEIEELQKELASIDSDVQNLWGQHGERIESIYAHFKLVSTAYDLRRYAIKDAKTGSDFMMIGWVPESAFDWFTGQLKEIPETRFESYEPEEDKHSAPPTKLKNKKLFRPFEMFVEMYGLPKYGSVDITPFVAVTFTLLFGIMFADFGQGFVLAVGAYLLYKLKGVKLAKVVVPCGISAMFFGLIVGSVFGNEELLNPLYHALGMKGKPLEVLDSINTVLVMTIGIGIALVIISMLVNVFVCIKEKQIGKALFDSNGLAGILLYCAGVSAGVSFMAHITIIPTPVCIAMVAVALPILYCKEVLIGVVDKHPKDEYMPESWADFIMQNFFEVIEYILSYFSNTLSFLRIGAYMLVHASLMMVFYSFAGEGFSVKGTIIIVLGNIVVIALEGLLSGIQVLRLEFYEMFSRFYEGDGKAFEGVGMRKNRGFLFKIKNAFSSDKKEKTEVIISTKN